MSDPIDHLTLAESRLATQFRDSENLINYLRALMVEAPNLEQVFRDIIDQRWLDTAEGVNLDILGAIVGQPRILVNASIVYYFGFTGASGAQPFGTLVDDSIGGRFRSYKEPTAGNRELTDTEYRAFIKSRIVKNSITPTIPQMISFFRFLFNTDEVIVLDGPMSYVIQIGRILSANEKSFLLNTDVAPKVAAVRATYMEYDADNAFGFAGIPNSLGFGSVNNSNIGGKFASLIS